MSENKTSNSRSGKVDEWFKNHEGLLLNGTFLPVFFACFFLSLSLKISHFFNAAQNWATRDVVIFARCKTGHIGIVNEISTAWIAYSSQEKVYFNSI